MPAVEAAAVVEAVAVAHFDALVDLQEVELVLGEVVLVLAETGLTLQALSRPTISLPQLTENSHGRC